MVEKINSLLAKMWSELNDNSSNYTATIEIFSAVGMAGESIEKIVSKALDKAIILGRTHSISPNEILNEIASSLEYNKGGTATHPNLKFIASNKFLLLKQEILNHLQTLLSSSEQTIQFWLKEGYPFYPVFWDYAFVIENKSDAYVLIGSASD
jgi:hypothetical protein